MNKRLKAIKDAYKGKNEKLYRAYHFTCYIYRDQSKYARYLTANANS